VPAFSTVPRSDCGLSSTRYVSGILHKRSDTAVHVSSVPPLKDRLGLTFLIWKQAIVNDLVILFWYPVKHCSNDTGTQLLQHQERQTDDKAITTQPTNVQTGPLI